MMTDPIADMLARIRNACQVHHKTVEVPASKMKLAIAKILKEEGYIEDFRFIPEGPQGKIEITLKYDEQKRPVIAGMKKVSKPGRRIYVKKEDLPQVLGGFGIAIISTSQGIMTDKEARKRGIGGEVICEVW
ncbi:ribosomal protein S8 [Thermodesulfatator indicus DSM 15286]|uniref:Small ribosomal subunit protein uS8 n=1 Tax=Thermodesulfatator indicus (strain DSM 15286 / JCM 11887 / CIR29812) TaxID=667014 RepID=F8AA51_THEID|nr:30S ribosomal protein S8 [Thermodesulfatator indicus]AEH45339.1 ribosomal protein S8 [Thermodesulfatator indicus DSM 15286]